MKFSSLPVLAVLLTGTIHAADPLTKEQWGLVNQGQKIYRTQSDLSRETVTGIEGLDINWPGLEALSQIGKGREVIVAVIDTGIDMNHPEFKGRLYKGKDFLEEDAAMVDDSGHGTHVAGIIAANADGVGTVGVTPEQVKILPLKVLNKNVNNFLYKGKFITDIFANAIAYAIEAKASVINMSLGWPQIINTPKVVRALDVAYERGVVIVAASGNNNKDVPTWPCAHPAVICVGAMDNQGKLTEFSNHGGKVDLVAPGEYIVSTIPRVGIESYALRIQGYDAKNGSSQAAPFVAATVAMLKLQDPNMTIEEVKLRLYSSAKKLSADKDQRFVRFGALNMKDALALRPEAMASVLVKGLLTVGVDLSGQYSFTVPLEILGQTTEIVQIEIDGLDARSTVNGANVSVQGRLNDLNQDSEIKVTFTTTLGDKTTQTSTTISFARAIKSQDMTSVKIPGIPAQALMAIQGGIRVAKVFPVSVEDAPSSDAHFYVQAKSGASSIKAASFRANMDGSEIKKTVVTLNEYNQVMGIFEKDVNFDGVNDLIFYGKNAKEDHLVLTFTDLSGNLLFGAHSRWELPITTFGDLPTKGDPAFSWLKVKSHLGDVLVPYYPKKGMMPELDNSKNILDHEKQNISLRYFYWEPYLDGSKTMIRPRVIDTVSLKKQLRKTLTRLASETVQIERLLPQSTEEKRAGSNRHLVSVGEGFGRRFFILRVTAAGVYTVTPHGDNDAFIAGNNVIVTRSIEDFTLSKNSFLIALLNRSSARVKPLTDGATETAWNLQTTGWLNQFQDVVGSFEGLDRRAIFIESRYHVYVYDQQGGDKPAVHRLPINRDSSIPQVQFSETIQTVLVRDGEKNQPAVAINSTWIFGDKLYTMVSDGESLKRPVALSVVIPNNCVPVKAQMIVSRGFSAYTMLCQQADGAVLSFFPLRLK